MGLATLRAGVRSCCKVTNALVIGDRATINSVISDGLPVSRVGGVEYHCADGNKGNSADSQEDRNGEGTVLRIKAWQSLLLKFAGCPRRIPYLFL